MKHQQEWQAVTVAQDTAEGSILYCGSLVSLSNWNRYYKIASRTLDFKLE
ncbi:hypothetical protein ABN448_07635 [Delftia acidovorans]